MMPINIYKRTSSNNTDCPAEKIRCNEEGDPIAIRSIPCSDASVSRNLIVDQMLEDFFSSNRLQNYLDYNPADVNVQKNLEFLNFMESSVNLWADESNMPKGCDTKKKLKNSYSLNCEKEYAANLHMHSDTLGRNVLNKTLGKCDYTKDGPCSSSTVDSADVLNFDIVDVSIEESRKFEESDDDVVIFYSSEKKFQDSEVEVASVNENKKAVELSPKTEKLDNRIITEKGESIKKTNNSSENLQEAFHKSVLYIKNTTAFKDNPIMVVYAKHEIDPKGLMEENNFSTTNEDPTITENSDTNSSGFHNITENEVNCSLHDSHVISINQEANFSSTNNYKQQNSPKVDSNYASQDNVSVSSMYSNNPNSESSISTVKNAVITNKIQTERVQVNVSQCISGWKIKFPWVEFYPKNNLLICSTCSDKLNQSVVREIKSPEAVYKVATDLLKHSISEKHILLQFVDYSVELDRVFILLRDSVGFSKETLFKNVKHIIAKSTGIGSISESTILLLVKVISVVVKEYIMNILKSYSKLGVSYIHDNCRRILIARFCRDKLFPEEVVVTDYIFSQYSLKEYLSRNNLDYDNNITLIRNLSCSKCHNFNYSPCIPCTLPIRLLSFKTFSKFMLFNGYIYSYSKFVYYFSTLVKANISDFNAIIGIEIVLKTSWVDIALFNFLRANFNNIKIILTNLCSFSSNNYANICNKINIDFSDFLRCSMKLISTLFHYYYYSSRSSPLEKKRMHHNLIENLKYVKAMLRKEENDNSPFKITFTIIVYFIIELFNKNYADGEETLSEYRLYFHPTSLACNSDISRKFQKSHEFFSHILKFPYQQFIHSLSTFGDHLRNAYPQQECFTICKILKIFNETPYLRHWDLLHRFYILLATLPFLEATEERSVFEVVTLIMYLKTNYGKFLGLLLFPIVQEGFRFEKISPYLNRIKEHIRNSK